MFSSFSASMNFFGNMKHKGLKSELSPDMTVSGAYRISRDDSFGFNSFASEPPPPQLRPTKSTSDLVPPTNLPAPVNNISQSTANVSRDPRGPNQTTPQQTNAVPNVKLTKKREKERQRLEKKRIAEQKAREKQMKKEQERQQQQAKKAEQNAAKLAKKGNKTAVKKEDPKKKGKIAEAPKPQSGAPVAHSSQQYPSNTLQSSISKSSGPPPYSDGAEAKSDVSGNIVLRKPADAGSWDMISEHRQQIKQNTVTDNNAKSKPMVMDLNYRFETNKDASNSEV